MRTLVRGSTQSASGPVARVRHTIHPDALRSPDQPLDANTSALMERRLGHDFGRVRVHADERAAESTQAADRIEGPIGVPVARSVGSHGLSLQRQAAPGGTGRGTEQTPPTVSAQPRQHPDCDRRTSGVADPEAMIEQAKAVAITWTNTVIPMIGAVLTAPESLQGTIASEYLDRHFHCPSDEQLDTIRTTLQAIGALLPHLPLRCTNSATLCGTNVAGAPNPLLSDLQLGLCPEFFTLFSTNLRATNMILRAADLLGRAQKCNPTEPCYDDFSIPASVMVVNSYSYAMFARDVVVGSRQARPAAIPCTPHQPATRPQEDSLSQPQRLCQEAGRPTSRTIVSPEPPRRPFVQVGSGPAGGRLLEERHDASGNFVCDRGRRIDQTW